MSHTVMYDPECDEEVRRINKLTENKLRDVVYSNLSSLAGMLQYDDEQFATLVRSTARHLMNHFYYYRDHYPITKGVSTDQLKSIYRNVFNAVEHGFAEYNELNSFLLPVHNDDGTLEKIDISTNRNELFLDHLVEITNRLTPQVIGIGNEDCKLISALGIDLDNRFWYEMYGED